MLSSLATTVVTASKWARPRWVALQRLGRAGDDHGGRKPVRVNRLGTRREHEIDGLLGGKRQVALLIAGVCGQVARLIELSRVYEQREDDDVALVPRPAHQRQMAFVERAHRRHESDPRALLPQPRERRSQISDSP